MNGVESNLAYGIGSALGILIIFGVIHYFVCKSRWDKIFTIGDLVLMFVGIGAAVLYGYMIFFSGTKIDIGGYVIGAVFGGGLGLVGLYTLFVCWRNCHNMLEAILFPFVICGLIAGFLFVLAALVFMIGVSAADDKFDEHWK